MADRVGIGSFWEQAHFEGAGDHPLERELADRADALHRYRSMIADADASGRDDAAELLLRQHDREKEEIQRLRRAIARLHGGDGGESRRQGEAEGGGPGALQVPGEGADAATKPEPPQPS